MLIEKVKQFKDSLNGKTVLMTGAGGGIGYEAARALAWMGANVIIAEIDAQRAQQAAQRINDETASGRAFAYPVDIGDDTQVDAMCGCLKERYGFVDVVFNNATITPLGAVDEVSMADWDRSYAVNLRGPVMLVQKLLPDMKKRNAGVIVFVPSSGAAPFMGAYETFKTAQVEVSNTLSAELEGTGIHVFSIGPGLVKTNTAQRAIEKVAAQMQMSVDAFYEMNAKHIIDAEAAGLGFAIAVTQAQKYAGQEVSSIQVLLAQGLIEGEEAGEPGALNGADAAKLETLIRGVILTYDEQYQGWMSRNVFERQWVLRDFKKVVKQAADEFKYALEGTAALFGSEGTAQLHRHKDLFVRLKSYYEHQYDLLQGFEKNAARLEENSRLMRGWIDELSRVINLL